MKKVIYIGIALIAFIAGIFVFYIRPMFMPVRLGEIERTVGLYNSREIKVLGQFSVSKVDKDFPNSYYFTDYVNDCQTSEFCLAEVLIELPEEVMKKESVLIKELAEKNFQYQLEKKESIEGFYGAEVEITGYVQGKDALFNPPLDIFAIKVKEIKQISPIRFLQTRKIANSK